MNRQQKSFGQAHAIQPWVIKGIKFPHGTEFRGKYKGHFYYGKVEAGALILNEHAFLSPSAAAISITRNPVDGWVFWCCKMPGQSSWISLCDFKKNN